MKVSYLFAMLRAQYKPSYRFHPSFVIFFVVAGEDDEGSVEDEGEAEEEPEDAHESLTEAVEGEEEKKQEGGEEFIDKTYESQFCLETNFMEKEEQENSESTADSKGKKGVKNLNSFQII